MDNKKKESMKWYSRNEIPKEEGNLILATFERNKLKNLQIGRAQYSNGEFQIWCDDMLFCYHGDKIHEKFTHWAYENEYWKLLEELVNK